MPSDRNRSRSSSRHRSRSHSPPARSNSRRYSRSRSPGSRSPPRHRHRSPPPHHRRSRSPPSHRNRRQERGEGGGRGRGGRRNNNGNQQGNRRYEWGGPSASRDKSPSPPPVKSEEPNFGLSGKLAAETNTVKGVELKYNEPAEAAKPKVKWRLYVFKGDKQIDLLHIHRQSAFLFGRDRVVADIPIDHPSCSKQHAVLQFRLVPDPDDNNKTQVVKPFIIDLDSTNGTFLNGDQIPSTRFVEMRMKDVLKFGESTREYVLLHSG